jgi:arylsulfatase
MKKNSDTTRGMSRRDFIAQSSGVVATAIAANQLPGTVFANTKTTSSAKPAMRSASRPNLIFVFSDQERYFHQWPKGLSLPGHERLQNDGVTFHNHYCPAVMCTSSRSVMLTGLQTATNGMFENTDVAYVPNLSTDIPTIGTMLRKAGYYTAYKGKWHLNREFEHEEGGNTLTQKMDQYGFSDFYSPGDMIAHTLGGYEFDHLIAGSAITWLRRHGRRLTDEGKPWCLFVSLINPHDIMYFNTDAPGKNVQDTGLLTMHAAPAPTSKLYEASWDMPIAKHLKQPFNAPGRPGAHGEFDKMWGYVLGRIPAEEERWRRFNDFYINSIRSVDLQVNSILSELDTLKLTDRTAFIYTSDHGEMAGAHGLRGKGPFAYQEAMHLPMYVVHPDVKGGQDTRALTGHIDLVPTLLALAGLDSTRAAEVAGRELPGKDFSTVLSNPGASKLNSTRESVLFTYSGLVTNDGDLFQHVVEAKSEDKKPILKMLKDGFKPDMKKRGSLRTVFDGRYKFTRYFSPLDHNKPTTLDELYQWNDVELFDLATDPDEMINLGVDRNAHKDLILAMNTKLNNVIKAEIGVDDGRELPNIPLVDWTVGKIS